MELLLCNIEFPYYLEDGENFIGYSLHQTAYRLGTLCGLLPSESKNRCNFFSAFFSFLVPLRIQCTFVNHAAYQNVYRIKARTMVCIILYISTLVSIKLAKPKIYEVRAKPAPE